LDINESLDGPGEAQGFFVVNGANHLKYVAGWYDNDACYRPEYMNGLLRHAGASIVKLPKKYEAEAVKLWKEVWGE
jgi:hypothetical protein